MILNNGIDVSSLSMLDEDMLKEIVPKVGDRAKLKSNINDWRKILDMANNKVNFLDISNDYPQDHSYLLDNRAQDLNISTTPLLTIPELKEHNLTPNTDDTESVVMNSEKSTHSSIDSKTDE
ncbi:SAM domain-containing protein, partial [Aphis craccivora]